MPKLNVQRIAMKAAGATAGAIVASEVDRFMPNVNRKVRGFGKILVGAIISDMAPKNEFVANLGTGMMSAGGQDLYKDFRGIAGIGSVNQLYAQRADGSYEAIGSAEDIAGLQDEIGELEYQVGDIDGTDDEAVGEVEVV